MKLHWKEGVVTDDEFGDMLYYSLVDDRGLVIISTNGIDNGTTEQREVIRAALEAVSEVKP